MFKRKIEPILHKISSSFPVTVLTGPRQSGKTTLLKKALPNHQYQTLESPDILLAAKDDPRGFLSHLGEHFILDEVQNCPELFSYLQEYVDNDPKPGKAVLSGSQNFLLLEKVSQTLAGRVGILELLPLTYSEFGSEAPKLFNSIWELLYGGLYPRPYNEKLDTQLWFNGYIRTYLERDVRQLINLKDLTKFQVFLKLCAGRHGQVLNLSELARDAGITSPTAEHWLSILEASYIVFRLQPYYKNFNKRLVKMPKLYFYDPGIVCQLLGIENSEHLFMHTSRGALFEGYIISEVIKYFWSQGKKAPIYYWREHSGLEVDLLIEQNEKLFPIEIKSSMTIQSDHIKSLEKFSNITEQASEDKKLVYAGDAALTLKNVKIIPWRDFLYEDD